MKRKTSIAVSVLVLTLLGSTLLLNVSHAATTWNIEKVNTPGPTNTVGAEALSVSIKTAKN